MKKFLLFLMLLFVVTDTSAQIEVSNTGKIVFGKNNSITISKLSIDPIAEFYSTSGISKPAYVLFGPISQESPSVIMGEYSKSRGMCWLHGRAGFLITKGRSMTDTLAYTTLGFNSIVFKTQVQAKQFYQLSPSASSAMAKAASADSRLAVDEAVGALRGLNAITFKEESYDSEAMKKASVNGAGLQYGLNTAELKALFPSLVYTDSVGNDYVNYIGLVPVLVEAVKNLSSQVAELQESGNVARPLAVADNQASNLSAETLESSLGQNRPNPFRSLTAIPYTLGDNVVSAAIYIYDMQGAQIASYQLDVQERKGSLEIEGSTLAPGMYLYALIADGMEIATKRMIITD